MSIVEKAAERLRQAEQSGPSHGRHHAESAGGAAEDSPEVVTEIVPRPVPADPVVIEDGALMKAGLAPPKSTAPLIGREYQRIKRPILASLANDPGRNKLMVTSALPSEGKTFTSMNLALSLARERDYSVLLVDGDVVKPVISRALGLRERPGLMDLLGSSALRAEDVMLDTTVPGLSVLPAGQRCDQMAELLSSQRMAWLADHLAAEPNRIVVFDSSPLLLTAESQALALNMGQVLMVVRAGRTERRAIDAALSLIATPEIAVNLVLNQSRKSHGDAYAGYYGMYYDHE